MDLDAVFQGLADAADVIDGLVCLPYTPDHYPVPCFYVGETTEDFDKAMNRGRDDITVICRVMVSRADPQSAQSNLNKYLAGSGATSLKAALEAARGAPGQAALGGACDDFRVTRISGHRIYTAGDNTYLGAEFTIYVIGSGD